MVVVKASTSSGIQHALEGLRSGGHAALVTALATSTLTMRKSGGAEERYSVSGGHRAVSVSHALACSTG